MARLKDMERAADLKKLWYEICGYILFCQNCGFLTEECGDEEIVKKLAGIEFARVKEAEKGSD